MVLQDQTEIATFSPASTKSRILTVEPGAGEIYYCDTLIAYSDGQGSNASIDIELSIFPTGIVPDPSTGNITNGFASTGFNLDGTSFESLSRDVGAYLSDGLVLEVHDIEGGADAVTITVVVQVRQVV